MIVFFKTLHIAALVLWSAGLVALPLMLAQHHIGDDQERYARIRRFTHYSYTRLVTPAAVIAITAGTVLIFLRDVFLAWLFMKLAAVALLVVVHAWIGHVTLRMGEQSGETPPPNGLVMVFSALAVMSTVLVLVLAKPVIDSSVFPDWLRTPRDRQLPVDEVPS